MADKRLYLFAWRNVRPAEPASHVDRGSVVWYSRMLGPEVGDGGVSKEDDVTQPASELVENVG